MKLKDYLNDDTALNIKIQGDPFTYYINPTPTEWNLLYKQTKNPRGFITPTGDLLTWPKVNHAFGLNWLNDNNSKLPPKLKNLPWKQFKYHLSQSRLNSDTGLAIHINIKSKQIKIADTYNDIDSTQTSTINRYANLTKPKNKQFTLLPERSNFFID